MLGVNLERDRHPHEVRAYLPCNHAIGHKCLFGHLERDRIQRCPHINCITLRHACGHIWIPLLDPSNNALRDATLEALPHPCEMCQTPRKPRRRRLLDFSSSDPESQYRKFRAKRKRAFNRRLGDALLNRPPETRVMDQDCDKTATVEGPCPLQGE